MSVESDHSGADIRVLFLLCIALICVVAIKALDFDKDGLDDNFESQYSGFSTNAYSVTNLVGWWQLDEISGTNAADRSSNNLPLALIEGGSNTNVAYWASGLFSNAVQLNGTGRYLAAQSNAVYNLSNFTFSAWIKTTNAGATDAPVIARWLDNANHGWQLYAGTNGHLASRFDTTGTPSSETLSGDPFGNTTVITDQSWHHIALTYVASNKLATIYVDGMPEGQTNLAGTFGPTVGEFRLGHQGWNNWFSNRIDEVRIYNRALTADEITHLPETYSDFDGDGLSNLQEQALGYDPTVPDNLTPVISILAGNGQTAQPDLVLPSPLSVTLRHSAGNGAITNFPVTFAVTQGTGKINSTSTNVTVRTDGYGVATINYLIGGTAGTTNLINASARSGSNTTQVTFSEYVAAAPTLTVTNGLKLWLKADAGVTKDTTNFVSAWADQSTNGYSAAQSTQANKPLYVSTGINSRASIHFDGTNDFLKTADGGAISTVSFSWFVVTGNVPAKDVYFMGGTGASSPANRAPFLRSLTNQFQIGHYIEPATANAKTESGTNVTSTTLLSAIVDDSAKTIKGYIKGSNVISSSGYSGNTATSTRDFHVGAAPFNESGDPLAFMSGDISEVVVYNRALSDSERQSVEAYLGTKYNITAPIATPTFSPDGGSYTNAQSVAISAATMGSTIRYTTNGVDPSLLDTVIASGSNVLVNIPLTLKAKAWVSGLPCRACLIMRPFFCSMG